jgi:predicted RNA-binding Zn-ribbon protein involved in translation (DUF1610 family)
MFKRRDEKMASELKCPECDRIHHWDEIWEMDEIGKNDGDVSSFECLNCGTELFCATHEVTEFTLTDVLGEVL